MKGIFLHIIFLYLLFSSCRIQKNNPLNYSTDGPLIETEPAFRHYDFDGVADGSDKEKHTPLLAAVDVRGISLDTDGDGCLDSEDPEPCSDLHQPMIDCENVKLSLDSIRQYVEFCRPKENFKLISRDWYLPMIFFDYNSSVIRKDAEPELNYIIEIMETYTCLRIIISGHRIDIGKTAEPAEIAEERSGNAIQYLTDHGISPDRISIEHTYLTNISYHYEVDFNQLRRVEFHIKKN